MKKIMPALAVGALALTLLVPSAYAAGTTTDSGNFMRLKGLFSAAKKVEFRQRGFNQEKLMELVNKYTPELTDQFKTILDKLPKPKELPNIDEAAKQKMEENRQKISEIRQKVKDGTLTEEEAKAEMNALGFKVRERKEVNFKTGQKDNTYGKLIQAVKDNDEDQIKKALNQLLSELETRVQGNQ